MRERVHFMGNGYANQVLDLIKKGRSVNTIMNTYDFTVLRTMLGLLDGVRLDKMFLTVEDSSGTFETTIQLSQRLAPLQMQFIEQYRSVAYLLYDDVAESGYLLTEDDERLLI